MSRSRFALSLVKGASIHIDDRIGCVLRVRHGVVWLTSAGDERDVILRDGEAAALRRQPNIVLSACDDAVVHLEARGRDRGVAWRLLDHEGTRLLQAMPAVALAAAAWRATFGRWLDFLVADWRRAATAA